jgi:hypothetical protein
LSARTVSPPLKRAGHGSIGATDWRDVRVPYPGGATDGIERMVAADEVTKPSAAATRANVHEDV